MDQVTTLRPPEATQERSPQLEALRGGVEEVLIWGKRALEKTVREEKLPYHNEKHIVQTYQLADLLLDDFGPGDLNPEEADLLLRVIVENHDNDQLFEVTAQGNERVPRTRSGGISEKVTAEHLLAFIDGLNLKAEEAKKIPPFTEKHKDLIRQALDSTYAMYDLDEKSVIQPRVKKAPPESLPTIVGAMYIADMGAAGMCDFPTIRHIGNTLFFEEKYYIFEELYAHTQGGTNFNNLARACDEEPTVIQDYLFLMAKWSNFQVDFTRYRKEHVQEELGKIKGVNPKKAARIYEERFTYFKNQTKNGQEIANSDNLSLTIKERDERIALIEEIDNLMKDPTHSAEELNKKWAELLNDHFEFGRICAEARDLQFEGLPPID